MKREWTVYCYITNPLNKANKIVSYFNVYAKTVDQALKEARATLVSVFLESEEVDIWSIEVADGEYESECDYVEEKE